MGTIKNNHNYMVQIIHSINLHFFFLNHTFIKYVIVSHYLAYSFFEPYIYNLDSSVFAPNNSLATKIKNLESNWIWTL